MTYNLEDDFLLALQLQEEISLDLNLPISNINSVINFNTNNEPNFLAPQKKDIKDNDYALALSLEKQLNETDEVIEIPLLDKSSKLSDHAWELIDPNPDARLLFVEFDDLYFRGKLKAVEISWSKRMTLCAGICSYQNKSGFCSIRLSEPLLKLRPRKDLLETLLHEMIHAYLFVTNNNRDRDGHGPEFQSHMKRINKETGLNITIYHTFHDEVENYKQHWWRCDGPCQYQQPFFGYVKRAMNRAPSSTDTWWLQHAANCNGKFTKIKEPENLKNKNKVSKLPKEGKSNSSKSNELNKIQNSKKVQIDNALNSNKDQIDKRSNSSNILVNSLYKTKENFIGLEDLNIDNSDISKNSTNIFSGKGYMLGSNINTITPLKTNYKNIDINNSITDQSYDINKDQIKNSGMIFTPEYKKKMDIRFYLTDPSRKMYEITEIPNFCSVSNPKSTKKLKNKNIINGLANSFNKLKKINFENYDLEVCKNDENERKLIAGSQIKIITQNTSGHRRSRDNDDEPNSEKKRLKIDNGEDKSNYFSNSNNLIISKKIENDIDITDIENDKCINISTNIENKSLNFANTKYNKISNIIPDTNHLNNMSKSPSDGSNEEIMVIKNSKRDDKILDFESHIKNFQNINDYDYLSNSEEDLSKNISKTDYSRDNFNISLIDNSIANNTTNSSNFVICPICTCKVSNEEINSHLDSCLVL